MTILTDRKWTIVGIMVAFVAIIISTWTAYDIYGKSKSNPPALLILEASRVSFQSNVDYVGMKLDYYLNGKRAEHVISSVFTIRNTGGAAIVPSDYYSNLVVQATDGLSLIGISTLRTFPQGLDVRFEEQPNQMFSMSPVLLNSGDEVTIALLIDARNASTNDLFEGPLVSWAARIKDVKKLEIKTIDEYPDAQAFYYTRYTSFVDQMTKAGWLIYLTAYSAPVFIVLMFVLFIASFWLLKTKGYLPGFSNTSAILLVVFFLFSMSSSEVIIWYAFSNPYGFTGDHYLNSALIAIHLLLFAFIALRKSSTK